MQKIVNFKQSLDYYLRLFDARCADGDYLGEYLIERNPHICRSEHTVLDAVVNKKIDRWCSHLSNVCMINIRSITPQRLNGADFDKLLSPYKATYR